MRKTFILFSLLLFNYSLLLAQPQAMPPLHGNALEFIPNKGQVADMNGKVRNDVLFNCPAGNMQLFLREKGLSYVITSPHKINRKELNKIPGKSINDTLTLCRVDMDFVGAANPSTETTYPTEGYMNFFLPHCPNGITHVKGYNTITYKNMYPSIDIVYAGTITKGLKYNVVVSKGGDASEIKMRYTGAKNIRITDDGRLEIVTATGKMTQYIPRVYQDINGAQVDVKGAYKLIEEGNGQTTIGFSIPNYNKEYSLTIDPWWSTYTGGAYEDYGYGCAFDNNNDLLVTGSTGDINFPTTPGVFQFANAGPQGNLEAFVIKFTPTGSRIWATYYGGTSGDAGNGVAADASNNVIFTGTTSSPNFPVSPGAFQTTYLGTTGCLFCSNSNAFVVKLDPTGATRLWGTFYGGNDFTQSNGVAVDPSGNIAIGGTTSSKTLPVSVGCFQGAAGSTNPGIEDAFAADFSPTGALLWGTYVGGSLTEWGDAVAVDNSGSVYLTGSTQSSDYPTSALAFQTTFGGGGGWGDAFLIKFNSAGTMQWSTYMGGSNDEGGHGVGVDGNNDVVVTGLTLSTNFPVSAGAYQTTNSNVIKYKLRGDFLIKFNTGGTMQWSTYSNVNTENGAQSLSIDEHNYIYVTDDIEYNDPIDTPKAASPPISGCAFDKAFNATNTTIVDVAGGEDNFITKYNSGGFMVCQTYLGGSGADEHEAYTKNIDVKNCRMAITGGTSGDYIVSKGAFQTSDPETAVAAFTAYVTDLNTFACGDTNPPLTIVNSVTGSGCSPQLAYHLDICDSTDTAGISFAWTFTGGTPSTGTGQTVTGISYSSAGTYAVTVKVLACSQVIDSTTTNVTVVSGSASVKASKDTICAGTTTTITASGGTTYAWSTGATTSAISVTPGSTTTYSVVITSGACKDTSNITVKVNPLPVPGISGTATICSGASAIITATGGATYSWNTGATSSSITVSPASTTTYTVQVANGTCFKDTTFNITVNPSPTVTASASKDTICTGSATTITATGGGTYSWSNGATSSTISVTPGNTTTYKVIVTSAGCKDSTNITVKVDSFPKPVINGLHTICFGNPVALSATGGVTYSWNTGATTSNITVNPSTTTSYTVTAYNGPCSAKDSITISIAPGATGNACCDTTIKFGGSASLVVVSAGSGSTYAWAPATGLSCTNCISPNANPTSTTKYYVVITDSNGCTRVDSVIVTVLPEDCGEVFVPNAFSPNGDNENDILYVYGNCINTMLFQVFDRWGNKVFESTNRSFGWDGKYNGVLMNTGVYVYKLQALMLDNTTVTKKGNVTLMR